MRAREGATADGRRNTYASMIRIFCPQGRCLSPDHTPRSDGRNRFRHFGHSSQLKEFGRTSIKSDGVSAKYGSTSKLIPMPRQASQVSSISTPGGPAIPIVPTPPHFGQEAKTNGLWSFSSVNFALLRSGYVRTSCDLRSRSRSSFLRSSNIANRFNRGTWPHYSPTLITGGCRGSEASRSSTSPLSCFTRS
jgi:hypothetical protein